MTRVQSLNKPSKAIVVLLDLLGTKEIYKDTGVIRAINKEYDDLLTQVLNKHDNLFTLNIEGETVQLVPEIRFFSDTILIIIDEKQIQKVTEKHLLDSILFFYCRTIRRVFYNFFIKKFFLRGAISYGDIWVGNNLIIGPAIDEAASWYDKADWIGIFLTPCAMFAYRQYRRKFSITKVVEKSNKVLENEIPFIDDIKAVNLYDIPFKEGICQQFPAITWPLLVKDGKINGKHWTSIFNERPIYPNIYSKYKNTINFYDFVIKNTNEQENNIIQVKERINSE